MEELKKWKALATLTSQKLAKVDACMDKLLRIIPRAGGKEEIIKLLIEQINLVKIEINGEDDE